MKTFLVPCESCLDDINPTLDGIPVDDSDDCEEFLCRACAELEDKAPYTEFDSLCDHLDSVNRSANLTLLRHQYFLNELTNKLTHEEINAISDRVSAKMKEIEDLP